MQVAELGWDGGWARAIDATSGGQSFSSPALIVGLAHGAPHDVMFRFDGKSSGRIKLHAGDLQIVPPGIQHDVEWPDCRFSMLGIDARLLTEASVEARALRFEGEPRLRLRDPLLEALVTTLAQEAREYAAVPSPWRSLYRDTLSRAVVQQLMHGRPISSGVFPRGSRISLAKERLTRVVDFIECNLSMALDLKVLADVAGLSPFHFARSFRAALGTSPVRYVAMRRITRATDMLSEGRHSLEVVARACGMGNVENLRRILRRRVRANHWLDRR